MIYNKDATIAKETAMKNFRCENKIIVIGHTHPDTDSVCSAIAYTWLKNCTEPGRYEARCAGPVNQETAFALDYFGVEQPRICEDVHPQLKDIDFRNQPGISPDTGVLEAWNQMRDQEINTLCITDPEQNLLGLISLKDMANANMDLLDASMLSAAKTPYRNIVKTLKGTLVLGAEDNHVEKGRICIGTSPVMLQKSIRPGDIVLVSDQLHVQKCAISQGASCVILCCGSNPSDEIIRLAQQSHCALIVSAYDTYQAARLISTAVPVRHLMVRENLLKFRTDTLLEDVRKTMARVRFQYFPVLDESGKYCGVVSRRNLLNPKRKQLILVDHNEKSQTVEGLGEAEILEIIDHHRLGAPETDAPVIFRNMPVGCTATIIYQIFLEQRITPPREIAGLMLSAILSDTLMFRSPTSTLQDKTAAYSLADLAGVCLEEYANQMFEAGSNLSGKTAEELFFSDFKVFHFGAVRIGVGQLCLMTETALQEAEKLIRPYLAAAQKKTDVTDIFVMLTNTLLGSTKVLFYGKNTTEIMTEAFHKNIINQSMILPGVVSRKKQFLPTIKAVMK